MSEIRDIESYCLGLLRQEVLPAVGCTEPVAVALATAKARVELHQPVVKVSVRVSANLYKNGKRVTIPGTHRVGLDLAAALGAVCGSPCDGLALLEHVGQAELAKADKLLAAHGVEVSIAEGSERLFVEASLVDANGHRAVCRITGSHSSITYLEVDGQSLPLEGIAGGCPVGTPEYDGKAVTLEEIFHFAQSVPVEELGLMEECIRLNGAMSREGLEKPYGMRVGWNLMQDATSCTGKPRLVVEAMARTASACDARMGGAPLSVMSNSGSGNQGLTVTIPVIVAAEQLGSSHDSLLRALALAHLVAIHMKGYLGRLSALCGCVLASAGAACGVVMLHGGDYKALCGAIRNMVGNVAGMLCDGAKSGCALKVAGGVSAATHAALLALNGSVVEGGDGIVDDDVEQTIRNLSLVGLEGMAGSDALVLRMMAARDKC